MKKQVLTLLAFLATWQAWGIDYGTVSFKEATYNSRTNTLDVVYDLTTARHAIFNYAVELYYSLDEGQTFNGPARLVRGDIGSNIAAGSGKTIQWDFSIEAPSFDGSSIIFWVKARARMRPEFYTQFGGPRNALWSALLPGLGDIKVRTGSPYKYYAITAAALGTLGAGIYYNRQAGDTYQKYLSAETPESANAFYSQAQQQKQTEQILLGAALAIWVADITLVAIKGFQNQKLIRQTFPKTKNKVEVALNYTPQGLGIKFTY